MLSVCILRLVSLSLVLLPSDRHKYYFQLVGCFCLLVYDLVMMMVSFLPLLLARQQTTLYICLHNMKNLTQRVVINNFNGKWLYYIRGTNLHAVMFAVFIQRGVKRWQVFSPILFEITPYCLHFGCYMVRCSYIMRTIAY